VKIKSKFFLLNTSHLLVIRQVVARSVSLVSRVITLDESPLVLPLPEKKSIQVEKVGGRAHPCFKTLSLVNLLLAAQSSVPSLRDRHM
jgi:hypothetical protein